MKCKRITVRPSSFWKRKIALYREREDRWSESVFLNNAAYLYYLKGEPQKAWNSFKLSLEICEKEGITQGVVLNALSLGRIMSGLNRENQAQPFYPRSAPRRCWPDPVMRRKK